MSVAMARARTARLQLALSAFSAAMLWGLCAAAGLLLGWLLLDLMVAVPGGVRRWAVPSVVSALAVTTGAAMWRARRTVSLGQVALWVEVRTPSLRFALVTAVELAPRSSVELERRVASEQWTTAVARAAALAILRPLLLLIVALTAVAAMPAGTMTRITAPGPADALARAPMAEDPARSLLAPLTATVRAPSYARERERVMDEPVSITALIGSSITLRGRGDAARVSADVGGRVLRAVAERDRWRLDVTMGERPVAVRLSDGSHSRLLTMEPVADEPPEVSLLRPARDTVLREGRGSIVLEARLRDDHGIARGAFEYIVSTGSGELFRFRTGTVGATSGAHARELPLRAVLSLDALGLAGGDVVHLRAVGWDANDVTGPGMGVSETRSIRVARADEYDTLAVEGAPPPDLDADAISQRMLIIQAERLEARRGRLSRDSLVRESRALAQRQNVLRRRVAEIVFMRLGMQPDAEHVHGPGDGHEHSADELMGFLTPDRLLQEAGAATAAQGAAAMTGHGHDESPILNINRPLLEAYNHMWAASGELEIGEPARALPPMRRALEALQRARDAERHYVRGRAPRVVVDIARVRLASPQQVTPAARGAAGETRSPRRALSARLLNAVEMLPHAAAAAADSLLLLRLDALQLAPEGAGPLSEAVAALREGRDATDALVRARRAIDGVPHMGRDSGWRGSW